MITLNRLFHNDESTIGHLNFGKWNYFTCEDTFRDVKIAGQTRIPEGIYKLALRPEGILHQKYMQKFPEFHKGMIWLQDVPNFEWVYIHIGNTSLDSEGCILVGMSANVQTLAITESKLAYIHLYNLLLPTIKAGKESIIIKDHDRA